MAWYDQRVTRVSMMVCALMFVHMTLSARERVWRREGPNRQRDDLSMHQTQTRNSAAQTDGDAQK